MTGSTAERRRISRLIAGVTRRFCFEVWLLTLVPRCPAFLLAHPPAMADQVSEADAVERHEPDLGAVDILDRRLDDVRTLGQHQRNSIAFSSWRDLKTPPKNFASQERN